MNEEKVTEVVAEQKVRAEWDHEEPTSHTSRVRLITPDAAREIINNFRYDGQRAVSLSRVRYLVNEMGASRFLPGTIVFAELPNGVRCLIDGYHRLHAMILADISYYFTVDTYQAKDIEEIHRFYGRIDRGNGRSVGQVLPGLSAELGVSANDITKIAAAVRQIEARFGPVFGPVSIDEARERVRTYSKAAVDILNTFAEQPKAFNKLFRQSTALGIAILTVHDASNDTARVEALDYWHSLGHVDNLPAYDPRWWAFRHIIETRIGSTGVTRAATIPARYRAHYLAVCWNHWCNGRHSIKAIRMPTDLSQPVKILRTRYAS